MSGFLTQEGFGIDCSERKVLELYRRSADPAVTLHPFLGEARRLAAVLAARWRQGGDAPRQLLCFDSVDGLASAALCQGIPELNASVVVAPAAVGRTEALLDACGLSQRCLVHAGTPLDFPLRETYDRVVLFHALYPVRKSMGDALAAVAARLRPGGELCSAHWFCLEACETAPGGLRDLDKAVLTDSHPLCHVEQFCQRLEEVGLGDTARAEFVGEYGSTKLHFGRKPAGNCEKAMTIHSKPDNLLGELHANVLDRLGNEATTLTLERVVLGIFFTGVKLSNGAGGMCATPIKSLPEAVCCPSSAKAMPTPGKIVGRRAVQMLDDLDRPQDLRRALAIATLNALAETLWLRDGPPTGAETLDGDAFDALVIEPGQRVVLVGAFPPYMRELRQRGQPFNVLEMDPATLKPEELPFYIPAERAPEIVPQADVFITTGTTLVNGTLDALLRLLKPGAQAAVIGPTATLVAEPYRRRGVTVVGGTRVLAADELLNMLTEGGSGYHFFGKTVERVTLRLG